MNGMKTMRYVQRDMEKHHCVGFCELRLWCKLVITLPYAAEVLRAIWCEWTFNWLDAGYVRKGMSRGILLILKMLTGFFEEPVNLILPYNCERISRSNL